MPSLTCWALFASVIFMAIVGLSQGLLLRLIPLVFDRVLKPDTPDKPALLFSIPHTNVHLYLNQILPSFIHNIFTMVAIGIVLCFLAKGVCDYLGNYLVNWVGISAVMDLRQEVFEQVMRQDSQFFEDQTTGRIMSSIMIDIDKIQVAVSNMLADWLRQTFTATAILLVMVSIDWKLSLICLIVFPVVAFLTMRLGRRIRKTTRHAQDMAAGLNQILQETISGHQVVKSFGAEDFESKRFRARFAAAEDRHAPLCGTAGTRLAHHRIFRRAHYRVPAHAGPDADQRCRHDRWEFHHVRPGAGDAL